MSIIGIYVDYKLNYFYVLHLFKIKISMYWLVEITEGNDQFKSVGNREERQFQLITQSHFVEESSDIS